MERNIKELLDRLLQEIDPNDFISKDPVQIPHSYTDARDVEISAVIVSIISWGTRKAILSAAYNLKQDWDACGGPYNWLMSKEFTKIGDEQPIYRTLKGSAFKMVCANLYCVYKMSSTLGYYLKNKCGCDRVYTAMCLLGDSILDPAHIGSSLKGGVKKRLCMLFRWLVRDDISDLGTWGGLWDKSDLYAVLDVHVLKAVRLLGLNDRRTLNWETVRAVTERLRELDPNDPAKYDYALFIYGLKKGK